MKEAKGDGPARGGHPTQGVSAPKLETMSTISRDQVAHLAMLARIDLDDTELTTMAGELGVILDSVAAVGEVASADVPAMSHPIPLVDVTRADEIRPSLTPEEALSGAPESQDQRFSVPRILTED